MKNGVHIFSGLHKAAQELFQRGLRILAALTLSFILLGINPPRPAQAGVDSSYYEFVMIVVPSASYVCAGETMTLSVSINRLLPSKVGDTGPTFDKISAVMVHAAVDDENVGKMTSDKVVIGWTRAKPDTAEFTFKAGDKPGTTHVSFGASFTGFWLASEGRMVNRGDSDTMTVSKFLDVEVRKCTYQVEMVFQEWMPGMGTLTGAVDSIRLNAEEPTKFTGSTNWKLVYNFTGWMKCAIATISPVVVDYNARLVEEDLYITFTIHTLDLFVSLARCSKDGGSQSFTFNGGEMTVRLPRQGGIAVVKNMPYWHYIFIVTRISE
jgi:hypothetical protein